MGLGRIALALGLVCASACHRPNPNYNLGDGGAIDLSMIDLAGADLSDTGDAAEPPVDLALPPNVITIDDAMFPEGDVGETVGMFIVRLSTPSTTPVTVMAQTTDGTAVEGQDYEATTATLTFAPGALSVIFPVNIIGDTLPEANETFVVHLSNAVGATIFKAYATGTIIDDDTPSLSVANTSVSEGDDGVHALTFTVSLSAASTQDVSFTYATADTTAMVDDSDYLGVQGHLTISAGNTEATIDVPIFGDVRSEVDETLAFTISTPTNATILDGTASGTIENDDPLPTVSVGDGAAYEGTPGSVVTFRVWLSDPSGRAVSVDFATATGTASAADFTGKTGTVVFAAGETEKVVSVAVINDNIMEMPEDFTLALSTPIGATIDVDTGTGTIYDDDSGLPVLTVNSPQLDEGNVGDKLMVFTVSTPMILLTPVSFHARTIDQSATDGSDYDGIDEDVQILPASSGTSISVTIHGDTMHEANETFVLELSAPNGATFATPRVLGHIKDDDAAPILTMIPQSQPEGDLGAVLMTMPISLSATSGLEASMTVSTMGQSAQSPDDFAATNGIVRIRPGLVAWETAVPINGDLLVEMDETFHVVMSVPIDVQLAASQIMCTIVDDD